MVQTEATGDEGAEKSGWQLIETAPRDGTVVDVYCPTWGRMPERWWDDGHWVGTPHDFTPTHWMPVPKPPLNVDRSDEPKSTGSE
jgi:hypothetical protein